MQLFYSQSIENNSLNLDDEEYRHCIKVLRHTIGDEIAVTDGKGTLYKAQIAQVGKHQCTATIVQQQHFEPTTHQLHVAVAPTKNTDRIEWTVEKLVEIGVSKISFIHCEHSERKVLKTDRLQKIALSAIKQSLKFYLPVIDELTPFKTFIEGIDKNQNLFIGYCETEATAYLPTQPFTHSETTVLIGPEGDFSPAEVELAKQAGFIPISLGQSRLRTETAAIVAATLINSKFETQA